MTVLSYNGKKVDVKEGTPLKNAVAKLGYKPKYSCKKGDCNSCVMTIGGNRMKPCTGKVPPMPRLKSLQEKGLELK
jgi:aerobic-type carbon monoxide dehydrogenase small subunit (CoxS/CutS family)